MERHSQMLLAVWREACQHIEIHQSLAGIARLLADYVPLESLAISRIVPEHRLVAAVASAPALPVGEAAGREFTATQLKRLLAWLRRGEMIQPGVDATVDALLGPAIERGDGPRIRLAPLYGSGEALGALVIRMRPPTTITAEHERLIAALQEPLAVALENDRRLHELAALREAAEADRRSLLRRLGRQDIAERIVGEGQGLRHVMKRVDLVSASDAPVLLLGETGTGKEVVARAIHYRSDRRDGPFIRVNCGAIPRELIDSQLFGHEKGSFTGAADTRLGWFERADGGTLFLDEIGELPPDAQVRFLRVLQDSFIERVGGGEPIRVDVRVIAATHRDLSAMAGDGRFREDLWYRIAVFPILLPPLRERLDDIPELAAHFAQRAAVRFGLAPVEPTAADVALLRTYRWPGNIRELGAVLDRAAILGEGRTLEIVAALGITRETTTGRAESAPAAGVALAGRPAATTGLASLNEAIAEHIRAALRQSRGRIEGPRGAAAALGINPHTLRAKMRKLGVDWSAFREG
ncbi:MAG: sigma-54-dependent Fis family transcriptional regulator [Pirellulales bacterium]|nr:sigma-54-dependent Fis family transcriptional regulator [Pirellulales bacterium]